jgi:hypothetical protein
LMSLFHDCFVIRLLVFGVSNFLFSSINKKKNKMKHRPLLISGLISRNITFNILENKSN